MSSSPGCFRDISSLAYCLNLDFLASEIHYRLRVLAVMDPKTFSQGVLDTRHLTILRGEAAFDTQNATVAYMSLSKGRRVE